MSKRKRTSKRYRRTKRSRKARRRYRLSAQRAPSGVPIQNIVKQRYCTYISLAGAGATIPVAHFFRTTSTYDPDVSLGGGQPMGRDEMANFYHRYRVLGAKITVKWASNQAGSGDNFMVGCYCDTDAQQSYTSWEGIREAKKGTSRLITHQRNSVTTTAKYSAKKLWDLKDVKDNENIAALVGSDPSANAFFVCWFQRLDRATNTSTIELMVQIDYIVQYYEPKEIGRS